MQVSELEKRACDVNVPYKLSSLEVCFSLQASLHYLFKLVTSLVTLRCNVLRPNVFFFVRIE